MSSNAKTVVNGVDIDAFLAGRVNVHAKGVLEDGSKELAVWLAAMATLKKRGLTPEEAISKFSRVPGYNETATRTAINYWWGRDDLAAKFLSGSHVKR